jgi:Cof subfamily protein (haloacid dehalogenase superfamily)
VPTGLPKLIATDLDGTIVRSDQTVSDRTHAAFDLVVATGIPIVGVTGRGPRLLGLSRRDLPSAGYFVLAQGGLVIDITAAEPADLFADFMDGAVVAEVLSRLEAVVGPLSVMVEPIDALAEFLLGDVNPAWQFGGAVHPCSRDEALRGSILKAFAHSEQYDADELLAVARTLIGPEIVELTQAGLGYMEICPRGVTKASGLAVVAEHLGVDAADVLVFGDMPNDLPMFAYAGWRSVAVANAHRDVRAVADEVIGRCDDDAVARYLEDLLGPTGRGALLAGAKASRSPARP